MATNKQYIYRVYRNGAYLGLLNNHVINDFECQQEINNGGGSVRLLLAMPADDYDEGGIVDFNNQIKIYVVDDEAPNGQLIFQGFIASYKPAFGDKEGIEVLLDSYGATLNSYMIESGEDVDVNQNSQNASIIAMSGSSTTQPNARTFVIQSFQVGAGVDNLSAVEFALAQNNIIFIGNNVLLQVFTSRADAEGGGLTSVIASVSLPVSDVYPSVGFYKFTLVAPATITPGATLWARLTNPNSAEFDPSSGGFLTPSTFVYYDSSAPYAAGLLETVTTFDGVTYAAPVSVTGDAYIKTFSTAGDTTSPYLSQDPSDILRSIIDNYNDQGGEITYTADSIDDTGSSVSYTFNTNTVLEGINKCLQLAPGGWYWYIDQANNVIHFHKTSATPDHEIILGAHIQNLSIEKRTQELVNIVYFVGGLVGAENLFLKSVLQTSVDLFGRKVIKISDNNVTVLATAQIIANSYLTNRGQVNLRVDLDIIDNGGQAAQLGFDIESIILGQMVTFQGFGPQTSGSLWDVALWDIAKWDFDISDLSSLIIQITKVDYKPNKLRLSLSTVPPDVTKRIEDIRRNVDQLNVINNPTAPS